MKHLNDVHEKLTICFLAVAGTVKLHRIVAVNMAPDRTSVMNLGSQKAKKWEAGTGRSL